MPPGLDAFRLNGKIAVVTGAASRIGRATAQLFAAAGARVVMADHSPAVYEAAAAIGPSATPVEIDLTRPGSPRDLAETAERVGPIDVWANVAGVVGSTPICNPDPEEYYRILRIDLDGVFWCCAAVVPLMQGRRKGAIIKVSSAAADTPPAGLAAYAMSKGGVNSLTRVLAQERGPHGIRVNTLAPGLIVTNMVMPDTMPREERKAFLTFHQARSPLGVTGVPEVPEDMACALLYLASDARRFRTGQVLRVNGGSNML